MSKQIQLVTAEGRRLETTENFNLGPRLPNREYRDRNHLTPDEVKGMIQAVRRYAARHPRAKRFAHRDEAIILLTWRHGLRIGEALNLKWESIDLKQCRIWVSRTKGSISSTHPMEGDEATLLRKLRAEFPGHRYVFINHHGAPMGYAAMRRVIVRAAELAGIPFRVSPHCLRHATGFALANSGVDARIIQDWLGHANAQNTARYTKLSDKRFRGIWEGV